MSTPVEQMRVLLAERRAVVVVGTGVSIMATNNASAASWKGLLQNGVEYCADQSWWDPEMQDLCNGLIKKGRLLVAAQMLKEEFEKRGGVHFPDWLQKAIGGLVIESHPILNAVHALGAPLVTLNYDPLLERSCPARSEPITWKDEYMCMRFLKGEARNKVLHLHGYYERADSIVLDASSYSGIVSDQFTEAFRNAMSMTRSMIYVGCGGTFEDPHFEIFRGWATDVLKGMTMPHYRLVREIELKDAQALHGKDGITPVVYGAEYVDLPAFLKSLAPIAVSVIPVPATRVTALRLPAAPLTFGREDEKKALVDAILGPTGRPVCLAGGPGYGKSNLCLAALHDPALEARFGPRRYFTRLDGAPALSDLVAAIANTLGVVSSTGQPLQAVVLNELAREPVVLALDNIETPWEPMDQRKAVEEFLSQLITIRHLVLVATIRGTEFPGLLPWLEPIPHLNPLAPSAAREMFLAIDPDHGRDADLPLLMDELGGWPLAISLMAHQARGTGSIASVLGRWRNEKTKMLKRGVASDRLDNVHVSVDCSLNSPRMTEEAKRLWRSIAELPEGLAVDDLVRIGSDAATMHVLEQLALVFQEAGRHRILPAIRSYVLVSLPLLDGDLEALQGFFLSELAAELGDKLGAEGGDRATLKLKQEASNIEHLLKSAIGQWKPNA